jgi:hypothetical protein
MTWYQLRPPGSGTREQERDIVAPLIFAYVLGW